MVNKVLSNFLEGKISSSKPSALVGLTASYQGSGGSDFQHDIIYNPQNLFQISVVTDRINNQLDPSFYSTAHTIDFLALNEGSCLEFPVSTGSVISNGATFLSYLIYCKENGQLAIKHMASIDGDDPYARLVTHDLLNL